MEEQKVKGQIFSVRFVKKDGTSRLMNCRTGVTAKLKGGELPYNPVDKGLKVVFDLACNNYRMINLNTVYEVTHKKKVYLGQQAIDLVKEL